MLRIISLISVVTLFLASCSMSTLNEKVLPSQSNPSLSAGQPVVELYFADGYSYTDVSSGNYIEKAFVKGHIELENIAYSKQVNFYYTTDGTTWKNAAASYAESLPNNRERWSFDVNVGNYGRLTPDAWYFGEDVQFAISYTVNGQTYWDNNGGNNYKVSTPYYGRNWYTGVEEKPLYANTVLGKSTVALSYAAVTAATSGYTAAMNVMVKNLAYTKKVTVVYSTDNWVTKKEIGCNYASTTINGTEIWSVSFPTAVNTLKFAVKYEYNGITAWDNNFTKNYSL
jgi:hypothetical protein